MEQNRCDYFTVWSSLVAAHASSTAAPRALVSAAAASVLLLKGQPRTGAATAAAVHDLAVGALHVFVLGYAVSRLWRAGAVVCKQDAAAHEPASAQAHGSGSTELLRDSVEVDSALKVHHTDASPSLEDRALLRRLSMEASLSPPDADVDPAVPTAAPTAAAATVAVAVASCLPPLELPARAFERAAATAPAPFLCPLSGVLMRQPVVTPSGGCFELPALLAWQQQHGERDPVSGAALDRQQLFPNMALRDLIHAWAWGAGGASCCGGVGCCCGGSGSGITSITSSRCGACGSATCCSLQRHCRNSARGGTGSSSGAAGAVFAAACGGGGGSSGGGRGGAVSGGGVCSAPATPRGAAGRAAAAAAAESRLGYM